MNNIKNYFLLIRPLNVFISGLAMIASAAILDCLEETNILMLIVLIVMAFTAAANSINDVIDLEIDKINRPSRPIPSKNLKKSTVLKFSFSLFLFGSILSLQLSSTAQFLSIVVSMPLMIIYSTHLKSKPLIGKFSSFFNNRLIFYFLWYCFRKNNPDVDPWVFSVQPDFN